MWKIITFIIVTLILAYISRASLRSPRAHGFYRFFAWECILVLFLLNMEFWFHNPFAWHQIIAWILLFSSLVPLAFGVYSLRTRGNPVENRKEDSSLLAFEKTSELVTNGIYAYIRHPLYSSLLLLGWGIYFKMPSLPALVLSGLTTVFLFTTARVDETECLRFFGAPYQDYMQHTKRFIPFLF